MLVGVVNSTDPVKRDRVLRNTDVTEIRGVGRKMKLHLGAIFAAGRCWIARQKLKKPISALKMIN
ncbi:ultraviolet light resistance protein B [Pseudomonas sp. BTN1]|nr:ultraviolet light resistance protein B [Pseudomonas sp. BTN1]